MRKVLGLVLLGLGAALLAAGVVTTTWAPGAVKKTPIDVDTVTTLEGTAARIDPSTGELSEERPIRITSRTRTDTETSNDEVAVWVSTQCVVFTDDGDVPACGEDEKDERILDIGYDKFATDRVTGLAVNGGGYVPEAESVVDHEGLVNKWPFDAAKKSYEYWDGSTERAWPAEYVGAEELEGLDVYHYRVTIEDAPVEIAAGTDGTYSNQIDIFVEPRTGSIQQQTQAQQRFLEDGTPVLDLQAGFTQESLDNAEADAEDNMSLLTLVTKVIPIVGFMGGALFIGVGILLIMLERRRRDDADDDVFGDDPASTHRATV